MATIEIIQRRLGLSPSFALWGIAGLLVGTALALTGLPGIFVSLAVALLIVFGVAAAKFPAYVMGSAVCCLGVIPFFWGWQTGFIPKLFGDEVLLLFYLAVIPFIYLFSERSWQPGFAGLYLALALLICIQALSFTSDTDLLAIRTFLETYVLGGMLLVLFFQEASNVNPETVAQFVAGLTIAVAALSVLERIVQVNPVMNPTTNTFYLSNEMLRVAGGVYRPFVSFFHPSEGGTFMALGSPFVFRMWMQRKTALYLLGLLVVVAGLFANATRGVWVGVLVAILLELPNIWVLLTIIFPIAATGGWIGYLTFKNTLFVQRLIDPSDLFIRFEYWKVALKMFAAHPLVGVGHMRFKQTYLNYVQDLSNTAHFDIAHVFVADNMFLTTIVEHGLLGLLALLGFFLYAGRLLRKSQNRLKALGFIRQAAFVRCSELALVIYVVTGCFADVHVFTKATKYIFILIGLGLAEGVRSASAATGSTMAESRTRPSPQAWQS